VAADLGPWAPLTPSEVFTRFSAPQSPLTWWIAGGHALDLFVGHQTREHEDIDISILRMEATRLRPILPGWNIHLAHQGILTGWDGLPVDPPVNSLWCRRRAGEPWRLQVMLEEGDRQRWVCRRHRDLSVPLSEAVLHTPDGLPYMAPQLQLFMKAKDPRPKDEADFATVSPRLTDDQSAWLRAALTGHYPGHHWLSPDADARSATEPA
jgi:hypothetical protein